MGSKAFSVALAIVALASTADANVGRSRFPGTRATEPAGALREIAIEREELVFDLWPLVDGRSANVSATYHLDNRSAASVTARLVFVSGAHVERGIDVTFDGSRVSGTWLHEDELARLPASWNAPITTPAIGRDDTLGYETEENLATAFTIEIPPGRHELAVKYQALPQRNKSDSGGTMVHQLGYVLAPARDWGAFGTLDVTVDIPPGWLVATSPKLARKGDTLSGHFASLPADTIGITLQAPTSMLYAVLQIALPVLAIVVLVGGGFVLFWIGRRRRADDLRPLWPVSLPVSLCWSVAIGVSGSFAAVRSDLAIPPSQSARHGYGAAAGILLAVFVALIAIPIGMVIARAGSGAASRAK